MSTPGAELLACAIEAFWPSKKERELWLDLGERKSWSEADFVLACEVCVRWLQDHGLYPDDPVECSSDLIVGLPDPKTLRDEAQWLVDHAPPERSDGVGRKSRLIAPLVGSEPRTFANNLKSFRPKRLDHLWMRALASHEPVELDQILYHRRTRRSLAQFWGGLPDALRSGPSIEDRLVLGSLLALYQRRRPTDQIKGNRGAPKPRRLSPKPAAGLSGLLIEPVQAKNILSACIAHDEDPRSHGLACLVLEAVLTRAHLDAHASRSSEKPSDRFPEWVEDRLQQAEPLLGGEWEAWRFRVEIMRAYQTEQTIAFGLPSGSSSYIEASVHLSWLYNNRCSRLPEHTERVGVLVEMLERDAAGLVMLGSLIQSWEQKLDRD